MYINTFKYSPEDVSCHLCTEYVKKVGCTALRCPWLAERIEAGVVGYRGTELFKQRATLLYEDVGEGFAGAVIAARSLELWLLEDMTFAIVATSMWKSAAASTSLSTEFSRAAIGRKATLIWIWTI